MSQRGQRHQAPLSIQQVRRLTRLSALYWQEERDKKSTHTHVYTHMMNQEGSVKVQQWEGTTLSGLSPVHPNKMTIRGHLIGWLESEPGNGHDLLTGLSMHMLRFYMKLTRSAA